MLKLLEEIPEAKATLVFLGHARAVLTGIGEGVNPDRILLDQMADIANAVRLTA